MEENPAPTGFSWEYVPEINAAFLKPEGWIVSKKTVNNIFIVAFSEEDPDVVGKFAHGFTVVTARPSSDVSDIVDCAKQARDHLVNSFRVLTKRDFDLGSFKAFNCLCLMPKEKIGLFSLDLANPKTRTVFLITFESPAEDYDRYWNSFGNSMIDDLILDDEL
jgi:hypothetical protein